MTAQDWQEYKREAKAEILQPWIRHPEIFVSVRMEPQRDFAAGSAAE